MRHSELTAGVRFVIKDLSLGHYGDVKHLLSMISTPEAVYETCLNPMDWLRRKNTLFRS